MPAGRPVTAPLTRAYAGTGFLGSGFLQTSLEQAVSWRPDFIGCDAGSTDGGPNYLATGTSMFGRESTIRDMAALLAAARHLRVPLIIGSAGTGGGDRNLDWTVECLMRAAKDSGSSFKLATIASELSASTVIEAMNAGRVKALPGAPQIDAATLRDCAPIVAMMGTEPIQAAIEAGAEVVLCGRSSDAAIYAAFPLQRGVAPGVAWHAAKVLECGAAAVTHRTRPDGMFAWLEADAFTVAPPNPDYRCTPQSVAAHSLYENADPFRLREPPGVLDLHNSVYEATDERSVRVRGSAFESVSPYTVKLEGVRLRGYRSIVTGAVRDPYILGQLDSWLERLQEAAEQRIASSFPGVPYEFLIRQYGRRAVLGERETEENQPHEVLLSFEITAPEQEIAHGMAGDVRHIALHYPIPEWHGLITALAHAHSPAVIDLGAAYEFALHHVLELDDPLSPFRTSFMDVTTKTVSL
jgi:hypothetical protein